MGSQDGGVVQEEWQGGEAEEGGTRGESTILFVKKLAQVPGGELEEEQGSAGLPGVGSAGCQDELTTRGCETALFQQGLEGGAGLGLEVLVEGFEEGVEAPAEVETAIVAAEGGDADFRITIAD